MGLVRVYEIANELNMSSEEVLKVCKELGLYISSHNSPLTKEQQKRIYSVLKKPAGKKVKKLELKPKETKLKKEFKKEVKEKVVEEAKKEKEEKIKKEFRVKEEKEVKEKIEVKEKKEVKKEISKKSVKKVKEAVKKEEDKKVAEKLKVEFKISEKPVLKESEATETIPVTAEEEVEAEDFIDLEEERYAKKTYDKDRPQSGYKHKYLIDEEKRINIKKVLDKELDREEKEGRFRTKVKPLSIKRKAEVEKPEINVQQKPEKQTTISDLKERVIKRPEIKKVIELPEGVTIKQLSERIGIPSNEILQVLFNMGEMLTINQPIDKDIVEILSHELNFKYRIIDFDESIEEVFKDSEKDLVSRPPIVTVMGHVDHGKTTLLDAIRQSNVVSSEAGGITQKIGAYQITYNNRRITFIDTPGHEAFTTMRARGAKVTDIAVIVVAADDGIMPQTIEAINHAKEAGVPIIVAINKIDLPNAAPDKVKQGLTEYGLVSEDWGGETIFVSVSAKNKVNINELLEMILLVADLHEVKGNPNAEGSGIIIESKLDKNLGPVGTVLIKRGKINVGDFFVTGNSYGRIRTIRDENGNLINEATLSQPVEISGFTTVPQAGDRLFIVKNEKIAKDSVNKREYQKKLLKFSDIRRHITLEDLAELSKESEIKKLKIILKAESNGSLDAIEKALKDIEEENIKIEIIHKAVGAISDSDILLAAASDAIVIGFGVVPSPKAKVVSKEEDVEVRTYDVIYKLIDDIRLAFKGLLEPKFEEKIKGKVEIREIFKISKVGVVAGSYVVDGEVERGDSVRVIRDGNIIFSGKVSTLHRFKEDVKKVTSGYECGIRIENFQDVNVGDILEVYEMKTVGV